MGTWNNRLVNRTLVPLRIKQRYQHQIYEYLKDFKDKTKKINEFDDYLEKNRM